MMSWPYGHFAVGILSGHMPMDLPQLLHILFRGRRQGRQPLNPAMPRRVVVAAKHSFSYPGARPCRRPSPKILQPAGVFTFLGVRGGKKEGKIWRCVLEVLVGRFLVDFWSIFHNCLVLSTRKNRVIYNVFVPLASKKSFWQHAGNCVNTSVFARPGPQNTVNTVIFASRASKPRKYRGFALARSQKHRYLRCFFVPRIWKIAKTPPIWRFLGFAKTVDLTILGGLQKVPTTKITTTTTTGPSSNSYNNNNNNNDDDDADDDEDDDNNNDDNDDKDDNKDNDNDNTNKNKNENEKEDQKQQQQRRQQRQRRRQWRWRQRRCSSQHVMSASSDEIPLSLSLPRPLQASPVCEALQL